MASSTSQSYPLRLLHKNWMKITRFAVGGGFDFWIISDSSESSYSDVPARLGTTHADCEARVSPDAMSTGAMMRDDLWGGGCLDTSVTTWPTDTCRWTIAAVTAARVRDRRRLVGHRFHRTTLFWRWIGIIVQLSVLFEHLQMLTVAGAADQQLLHVLIIQ